MSYTKMAKLLLEEIMRKAQIPGVSIAYLNSDGVISPETLGLTDGFGLVKMSSDPTQCEFHKLGIGTKDTLILFNDALYFANQTTKTVQKIPLTETNEATFKTLQKSCTESYKLADAKELELIGDLTGHRPPTKVIPKTVFGAASLSKPVFAYLIQKLIQANATDQAEPETGKFNLDEFNLSKFDLDTPLFHILPLEEFSIDGMKFNMSDESAIASAKALTARMVLSHTTGLAHGEMKFQFIQNPEEKDVKEKEHGYSNVGIVYLQQVIEKLTGSDLQTLAKRNVFDICDMTHSTYEPERIFESVFHADKEPLFDEIQPGQIVILHGVESLTAYWLESGKMVNRSFPEKEVPTILEMLPAVGESSVNLDLINAIVLQYEYKEPESCAANTLRTTAEDYANFVKHLINDNTVENPFVPHAFMVNDKGLAGMIGVAKGSIPDPVLEHIAWGIGWGLQTNDEGRVITAYHSGDMNDFRAWVVIDLQDKDKKNAVVFFANSHNGHILAEQIIPQAMQIQHAANYFFPKWGFARNLTELGGKNTSFGIKTLPSPNPHLQEEQEGKKEVEKLNSSEQESSLPEKIETNANKSSITPFQTTPKLPWEQ
ncbi:MAG TPA: serine hydrolase domain-containing protein [Legionella sp.]|nr:serine hydrolase domain-containing protein [Legionella sp.]